ncbi:MAG: response regulator transcription factor [Candidatus Aminicenantes bacterium]|nr:response regulator transcription factor [Candidatus Aminicenantes bacterium]
MRILIIEDEGKIAAFLKRGLKEEGYAVDVAADGEQGYFLASTQDCDVIILDLMLPGLDGLNLCRKLRAEGNEARILVLTARDKVRDKVQGLNAGADDYLTKPFAFEELLARVRALLRKREAGSPTKLQVADLTMDLLTHKVLRAGREIELTAREFALLEYLIRNVGTVVTRTMIAEHVWDVNFDTFTNVIDVYMSYLRNKIDRAFPDKLIRTVRGRGYVIKG